MSLKLITALLTPYQAFLVKRWDDENTGGQSQDINLKIRPECFTKFPNWSPPSSDEVTLMLKATGMTQKEASHYLGLKDNNGRSFRRYTNGESMISYACWVMLCNYVGVPRFW